MAYRVKIGGVEVECDGAVEVAELVRAMDRNSAPPAPPRRRQARVAAESANGQSGPDFQGFLASLEQDASNVFDAIVASDGPINTDELAKKSGVPAMRLKYVMRSINTAAQRHGIKGDVVSSDRVYTGGKAKSAYSIPEAVRKAMR